MFVTRAYQYRLYPTRSQRKALEAQLGLSCDLYNAALEQRRDAYRRCGKSVGYHEQSAELRELRLAGLLSDAANFWSQQAVLRQLDRAFAGFFSRLRRGEKPGYPRFKGRQRFNTLTFTLKGNAGGVAITEQGRLRLQGVGCVKVNWHRAIPPPAKLGEVRVTRKGGGQKARWHVSISAELPDPKPRPATGEMAGLDLGVRTFAALSTGQRIPGHRAAQASEKRARRAARRVARRKRGSRRRAKAAAQLARHRERNANRRRDAAHKLSRALVDSFDLIAHEDLAVAGMMRSARGTADTPGRGVAAKTALNRGIADQGWAQFLLTLAYKAEEAGRRVVKVKAAYSSQTCAGCGAVEARSRSGKLFRCSACGHRDDADVNAAKVILARALEQEGISRPGRGRQVVTAALAAVA